MSSTFSRVANRTNYEQDNEILPLIVELIGLQRNQFSRCDDVYNISLGAEYIIFTQEFVNPRRWIVERVAQYEASEKKESVLVRRSDSTIGSTASKEEFDCIVQLVKERIEVLKFLREEKLGNIK